MERGWASEILDYWFEALGADRWWTRSDAVDAEIRTRFAELWEAQRHGKAEDYLDSRDRALATIILFDQFPRNLFRHEARAFATDVLARAIAEGAIARGYDAGFDTHHRHFLYMPFMHSESLADQRRSLALFEALGDDFALGFAREHHDLIARFGRFPHRNAALGRATLPEEEAAVEEGAVW
ncbi:MAG: DUF924 domain-containing protein [Sphingomonadaceae bacterium]|nr:DUF924 domain-containing protein [Sphingomonadaceae bacterium]